MGAPAGETFEHLLAAATDVLREAGVIDPEGDVRALADHVLAGGGPFESSFGAAVELRRSRMPLARILGWQRFRGLDLRVHPGVFLARGHAEAVAQAAIDEVERLSTHVRHPLVVDLCTGSGAIALAVAVEKPAARVIGVDFSAAAVDLATVNNAALSSPLLSVERGDATAETTLRDHNGRVDVVVANPPYIPPSGVPREPEVRAHDPASALFGGGDDGLDTARGMVATAARLLRPGGLLVLEHADVQGAQVRALISAGNAFAGVTTHQDSTGADRYAVARRVGPLRFAAASVAASGDDVKDLPA